MQQENGYKKYLVNEYKILKNVKSKYTLKAIIKEALKELGYSSVSENEVILHNLASLFESNKVLFKTVDDVFLFDRLGMDNLELQRNHYYKYVLNTLKNTIMFSENITEANLTLKTIAFDEEDKKYVKSQLFRCVNELGNTSSSPRSVLLSKIDYTYNKKSKETSCSNLKMNVCLIEENKQKILNTYARLNTETYNSNDRMVESTKTDRINRFYKYDLQNLEDIIPNEDEFFDLEIIRDNGASALFIKQNNDLFIEREMPLVYDIEEINYLKGQKFTYGNETLRNLYHKMENKPLHIAGANQLKVEEMYLNKMIPTTEIILNNDEDLFSRLYKFSENDMFDLTKTIVKEELTSIKTLKNIK